MIPVSGIREVINIYALHATAFQKQWDNSIAYAKNALRYYSDGGTYLLLPSACSRSAARHPTENEYPAIALFHFKKQVKGKPHCPFGRTQLASWHIFC